MSDPPPESVVLTRQEWLDLRTAYESYEALLVEAAATLKAVYTAGLTVQPTLDKPYPDDPVINDRLATAAYFLTIEQHWLVPSWARPHCSLDPVKMCTSWTCLVDRCARGDEGGGGLPPTEREG